MIVLRTADQQEDDAEVDPWRTDDAVDMDDYEGPDPEEDESGDGDHEDQGI